jgi:L-asparagine transporter-like permease
LSFRRRHKLADLPVRTPGFPAVQIAGLLLLCAVLVTMGLDQETWRISWIVGVPWLVLVSVAYMFLKARRAGASPAIAALPVTETAPKVDAG